MDVVTLAGRLGHADKVIRSHELMAASMMDQFYNSHRGTSNISDDTENYMVKRGTIS